MGVNWVCVQKMEELGLFGNGACRILDIGSSNLYRANAAEIADFVRRHNPVPRPDLERFAARMAQGSAYDPVTGGTNESFVGEVFEAAGMRYEAIDIAKGYRTTIVDLNRQTLPADFLGAFDLVINFGTTEHILNQMNSFRAIHEAAAAGGHIYHQLPAVGFVDHGYYCYTGRFFFDLAGYNGYDIVEFWFEGPGGPENIFQSVRSYQQVFPALVRTLARIGAATGDLGLDTTPVPTISANVVYRKRDDRPFMGTVETSTSVGDIPIDVLTGYADGR